MEAPAVGPERSEKADTQCRISEIVVLSGRLNEDILHGNTLLKAPTYYGRVVPPNRSAAQLPTFVVHETGRPPAPVLRYVDQVVGSPTDMEFRYSQGVLTAFDVDVVHVAEPNLDLLLGTRGASGFQRLLATLVLTRNLRRHRIALVRTLHHSGKRRAGRSQRLANRVLDRATAAFVVFDNPMSTPAATRTTRIPHPHFRDRYVGYPRAQMIRARVLCVSAGDLPAEAENLLAMPRVADTDDVTIRLAGHAARPLEESARRAVARHSETVSTRLERLSDGAQVQEIDAAELVVLPRVDTLSDLQLVFLVLSLDRPVLVPRTVAMAGLASEVGPGWVCLSDGPITAQVIDDAFEVIRSADRGERPDLAGRDLATTHAAYEAVFRTAASSRRRR